MPKNRKKTRKKPAGAREISEDMRRHIKSLGMSSPEAYIQWCRTRKFSASLNKTYSQQVKEYNRLKSEQARQTLQRDNRNRNLPRVFAKIAKGKVSLPDLAGNDILETVFHAFRKSKTPESLLETFLHIESISGLFRELEYVWGIAALCKYTPNWLRPAGDWKPDSHNLKRQFASLARHLLADYPVPAFMDKVWFKKSVKRQKWFIHIGKGQNIRTAAGLPIKVTKKIAHHFLTAPEEYPVMAAFRWGQVHALDGDRRTADALLSTRLAREFKHEDFWSSVIRFFVNHPMLDPVHINPIIDFIHNQKFQNRVVFVARGVAEEQDPEQPNFSMRNRTPELLLRQVDRWHHNLGRETRGGNLQWTKSSIEDFEFVQGRAKDRNMRIWRIRELLSSQELIAEGRAQSHCVATYANSCHRKRCSIWTMDSQNEKSTAKLLTIEVALREREIRQIRGKRNRLPDDKEAQIIKRWAAKEDLKIGSYLL